MREKNRDHSGRRPGARRESGFALVLAIMALMLLTFLGLTLATTTSTELQIATNYRWSQQALYNAEAGIEAGKLTLESLTSASTGWTNILPADRTTAVSWTVTNGTGMGRPGIPATSVGNDAWGQAYRNFENATCDQRGGNVGYGIILNGMQNVTTLFPTSASPQQLNGAVTVWIRRGVGQNMDGTFVDDGASNRVVLTAEGVAPFSNGTSTMAFAAASKAVRVLEASFIAATAVAPGTDPIATACGRESGTAGGAVSNSGFWNCGVVSTLGGGIACDAGFRGQGGARGSENAGTCGSLNTP